mmetsp:Transcript_4839/g.12153  ORF Transcript_4839/g.12153 Transcript_4839/m.12153 type:complete len:223 (+) Transcript_4839:790-1458(+)
MPGRLDRIRQRLDDLLAWRQAGMVRHVLGPGLARHRHLGPVEHPIVDHELDDARRPANILHVLHDVLAARFEVGQEGRFVRDSLKIVQADPYGRILTRPGHGYQMQHRVRRTARNHDHPYGVLEGAFGHNISRLQIQRQELLDGFTRPSTLVPFFLGVGGRRGRIGQSHAQRFDGRRHGIGRVHPTTGPLARTRMTGNFRALLLLDLVVDIRAVGLERRHDI